MRGSASDSFEHSLVDAAIGSGDHAIDVDLARDGVWFGDRRHGRAGCERLNCLTQLLRPCRPTPPTYASLAQKGRVAQGGCVEGV